MGPIFIFEFPLRQGTNKWHKNDFYLASCVYCEIVSPVKLSDSERVSSRLDPI